MYLKWWQRILAPKQQDTEESSTSKDANPLAVFVFAANLVKTKLLLYSVFESRRSRLDVLVILIPRMCLVCVTLNGPMRERVMVLFKILNA